MKVPEGTTIQLRAEADCNENYHCNTPGVCSARVTLTPADTRMEGLIIVLKTEQSRWMG
jgi:hypothetical protein